MCRQSLGLIVLVLACRPPAEDDDYHFAFEFADASLDTDGLVVRSRSEDLRLRPVAWGRGHQAKALGGAAPVPCAGAQLCGRRVEQHYDGLIAWSAPRERSIEQGWTLLHRTPGEGPIFIDLDVHGAEVRIAGEDEVNLVGGDKSWRYRGLRAWDAANIPLRARFARSERGLRVEVDDRGASYPIQVDPELSSTEQKLVNDEPLDLGQSFGIAARSAGDLNGDGYGDVAVSRRLPDAVHVFAGSGSGLGPMVTLYPSAADLDFGEAIVGGDFDADGFDDLVVGASGIGGRVYVYRGGLALGPRREIIPPDLDPADQFGTALGVGDFDADGYDDLVVNAPVHEHVPTLMGVPAGALYLLSGGANGLVAIGLEIPANSLPDAFEFGKALAVGDWNGDGFGDIAASDAAYPEGAGMGAVYLWYGGLGGIEATAWQALHASDPQPLDYFGSRLTGGDWNGDGFDDLAVGCDKERTRDAVRIFYGSPTGIIAGSEQKLTRGPPSRKTFGVSFAGVGDIDGDGYGDLVVGIEEASSGSDVVWAYFGSSTGLPPDTDSRIRASDGVPDDRYGLINIAPAGDVDGDGRDDVVISARDADVDGTVNAGAAYVYYGLCRDADEDGACPEIDCDDLNDTVHPDAPELCDGIDNNCDGVVDEADSTQPTWYVDRDGDGFGVNPVYACLGPADHVAAGGDCDDSDAGIHPGAAEVCTASGRDDDCDGLIDVADPDYDVVADDQDADGWAACGGDCDDRNAQTHPGAAEQCNRIDDDCDGLVDVDGAEDGPLWYADADGDGLGDVRNLLGPCDGGVGNAEDCDDLDPTVMGPVATYADGDRDGFGAAGTLPTFSCTGTGAPDAGDCVDTDAAVHPGAWEACNGVDDDCDGTLDEGWPQRTWYLDNDRDGYGDRPIISCGEPAGTVAVGGDCDDGNPGAHPGAVEQCDGFDADCDGVSEADADLDGWRACGGDCDDSRARVHPAAPERCNDRDDDCDGFLEPKPLFADVDGDGFGNRALRDCRGVENASDCDDEDAGVHPGEPDLVTDGIDKDCDGCDGVCAVDLASGPVPLALGGGGCGCERRGCDSVGASGLWPMLALLFLRRRDRIRAP